MSPKFVLRPAGVFLLAAILVRGAVAQAPSTRPTFTSHTSLVLVPVVVHNKSGAHVPGLKLEDFTVYQDGKEQTLASAEEISGPASKPPATAAAPGDFTNQGATDPAAQQLTIIAVDTINTPFLDQTHAREALVRYLLKEQGRSPVALLKMYPGGVSLVFDFTTDPEIVRAGLTEALKGGFHSMQDSQAVEPPRDMKAFAKQMSQGESWQIRKMIDELAEARSDSARQRTAVQETLEALQHIASVYAGLPGRKSLLWVTAGFPLQVDLDQEATPGSVTWLYERTFQQLNSANIAVYPVSAKGMDVAMTEMADPSFRRGNLAEADPSAKGQGTNDIDTAARLATLETVASVTGGQAFHQSNNLPEAFRRAAEDSSSYYMLSYYLDRDKTRPGWHKLRVKTARSGTTVRSRSGFLTTAPGAVPEPATGELLAAVNSPMDYIGLPLTVRWRAITAKPGTSVREVGCEIVLPADTIAVDAVQNNHMTLEFVAVARDPGGTITAKFSQQVSQDLKPETMASIEAHGLIYHNILQLPPGLYQVRFVVRDAESGRIGSVLAPLKVD